MIDEESLRLASDVPGYCGPLADNRPRVNLARARPFLWAILLWSGAVRREELTAALGVLAPTDDLRTGIFDALHGDLDEDRNRLELVADEVLGEELAAKTLRLRPDGLYVLTLAGLSRAISAACTLNAQLPDHLLNEQVTAQLRAPC